MRVSHLALDDFRSWKHGVVELKDAKLHAVAVFSYVLYLRTACRSHFCIVGFKLFKYLFGALYDASRHACYIGNMYTKRVL